MVRKIAYSIGSILMGGIAVWVNPLSTKSLKLSLTNSSNPEKAEKNKTTTLGFPHESLITLDKHGNIIIGNKTQPQNIRAIHPTGKLSPVLGSLQEAGAYFSPGFGGGQETAAYGYGYAGSGYPAYNGGDFSSGAAAKIGGETTSRFKKEEIKNLPEGKSQYSSAMGNANNNFMNAAGGGINSGAGGFGGGLAPASGPTSSSKSLNSGSQVALASPGSLESIDMSPAEPILSLENNGANQAALSPEPNNVASEMDENSNGETEPDFIPVEVGSQKEEKKNSNAAKPMQAPDRRNNAGNAEDSAKNAIPPILMNADDEKKKADEERKKQNYQKANEHDSKAAMLLAQAAAMAAAMAGNNNAKNKADSQDGQSPPMQPVQIPNFENNSQTQTNNQPQTVWIPNPNKANRSPASVPNSSQNTTPVSNPNIYIR